MLTDLTYLPDLTIDEKLECIKNFQQKKCFLSLNYSSKIFISKLQPYQEGVKGKSR